MIVLWGSLAYAATVKGQIKELGLGSPAYGVSVSCGTKAVVSNKLGFFAITCDDNIEFLTLKGPQHDPKRYKITAIETGQTFWLSPRIAAFEIIVEESADQKNVTERRLDMEQVERTPGAHDDPIRLLQSLPGFAVTREYGPDAGSIVIRGSAPTETRVLVDGVDLPYLYHFQQYSSVIHTRMLDSVSVYPSSYGAAYGDSIGGIISVKTKKPTIKQTRTAANINLIMAGAYVTTPIGDDALTFSGRRSYADLFTEGTDLYTQWPAFWDYLSRYDHKIDNEQSLYLTALGSKDSYGRSVNDPDNLDPFEQATNSGFLSSRQFHSLSLNHLKQSKKQLSDTVVAFTGDWKSSELKDQSETIDNNYLWVRHETLLIPSEALQFSLGFDTKLGTYTIESNATEPTPTLAGEADLLSRGIRFDQTLTELRSGFWAEPRFTLGPFTFGPGVRIQTTPLHGDLSIDPRITAIMKGDDIDFRMGGGRYSQSPTELERNDELGSPDFSMSTAWHGAVGANWRVGKFISLEIDGWFRQFENALRFINGSGYTSVNGMSYGTEFKGGFRIKERLFSWLTFTLMNAKENDSRSLYFQPYSLNGVVSWKPTKQLHFAVRYRYAAGMPYVPVVDSIYSAAKDQYMPIFDVEPSATLPDYQKLDLHAAYSLLYNSWKITAYAEMWYVPPKANVLYPIYNYNYSDISLVGGPSLLPLMGVRIER